MLSFQRRMAYVGKFDDAARLVKVGLAAATPAQKAALVAALGGLQREQLWMQGRSGADPLVTLGEAEALAQAAEQPLVVAQVWDERGVHYLDRHHASGDRTDLATAERWLRQAFVRREEEKTQTGMAESQYHLGLLAERRGEWAEAADWYRQARFIAENRKERELLSCLALRQGVLAWRASDWRTAREQLEFAVFLREELHWTVGLSAALTLLGQYSLEVERDAGRALTHLQRALALSEETGTHPTWQATRLWLARALTRQGDDEEAYAMADRARLEASRKRDADGLYAALLHLGTALLDGGERDKAADAFTQAAGLVAEGSPEHVAAASWVAVACASAEQWESALDAIKLAVAGAPDARRDPGQGRTQWALALVLAAQPQAVRDLPEGTLQVGDAEEAFRAAIQRATWAGAEEMEVRTLLAHAERRQAQGDAATAQRQRHQALTIARNLGHVGLQKRIDTVSGLR